MKRTGKYYWAAITSSAAAAAGFVPVVVSARLEVRSIIGISVGSVVVGFSRGVNIPLRMIALSEFSRLLVVTTSSLTTDSFPSFSFSSLYSSFYNQKILILPWSTTSQSPTKQSPQIRLVGEPMKVHEGVQVPSGRLPRTWGSLVLVQHTGIIYQKPTTPVFTQRLLHTNGRGESVEAESTVYLYIYVFGELTGIWY